MAKKSASEKAKDKMAGAAKIGADAVRNIAGEAIRAGAMAAAGVALQRTAEALRGGARRAESAAPNPPPVQGRATERAKPKKRAKAKKSTAKSARKKSAKQAKKRAVRRRRSSR